MGLSVNALKLGTSFVVPSLFLEQDLISGKDAREEDLAAGPALLME